MNKKIIRISYVFSNPEKVEFKSIYKLIIVFNITENLLLNYFRVNTKFLDLNAIKNVDYTLYRDENRDDNIYIHFKSLGNINEINGLLENNQIEFPTELMVYGLNCSYEYYINNLVGYSESKCIKEHYLNLFIGIYEDVIIIKFNRDFYYEYSKKLEDILLNWENSLGEIKYRKTMNYRLKRHN